MSSLTLSLRLGGCSATRDKPRKKVDAQAGKAVKPHPLWLSCGACSTQFAASTTHRHLLNRVLNFGQAGLLDRYIPPRATSTSHPSTGSGFNDRLSLNFFSPFFFPYQLRSLALRIYYNGQSLLYLLVYTLSPLRASYHRSLNTSATTPRFFKLSLD